MYPVQRRIFNAFLFVINKAYQKNETGDGIDKPLQEENLRRLCNDDVIKGPRELRVQSNSCANMQMENATT